jgi:hypothetical protein
MTNHLHAGFAAQGDDALKQYPALVYTTRRSRNRFAENVVEIMDSEQQARDGADEHKKLQAAVVCGPIKSSEGFRLYYLVRWLK